MSVTTLAQAYAILGVTEEMSLQEIRMIRRKLVRDSHPDRVARDHRADADQRLAEINAAFDLLVEHKGKSGAATAAARKHTQRKAEAARAQARSRARAQAEAQAKADAQAQEERRQAERVKAARRQAASARKARAARQNTSTAGVQSTQIERRASRIHVSAAQQHAQACFHAALDAVSKDITQSAPAAYA